MANKILPSISLPIIPSRLRSVHGQAPWLKLANHPLGILEVVDQLSQVRKSQIKRTSGMVRMVRSSKNESDHTTTPKLSYSKRINSRLTM